MMLEIYEDPTRFHEILEADFEAGTLLWRWRDPLVWGKSVRQFNGKYAGTPAFVTEATDGGFVGSIGTKRDRKYYYAHRVLWAMYHGAWPKNEIDHIDGNRKNNAISNLRDVTRTENARNMPLSSANKSGVIGVRNTKWGWQAYIHEARKLKHLGFYKDRDAAVAARKQAERELGFHPNHGRAAA